MYWQHNYYNTTSLKRQTEQTKEMEMIDWRGRRGTGIRLRAIGTAIPGKRQGSGCASQPMPLRSYPSRQGSWSGARAGRWSIRR